MAWQHMQVFVLGPPAQGDRGIVNLLRTCLEKIGHICMKECVAEKVYEPITVKVPWVMHGEHRERFDRPGMRGMELWNVVVSWFGTAFPLESFALIVMDVHFFQTSKENEQHVHLHSKLLLL